MVIDLTTDTSYELSDENILVTDHCQKSQIVLCDTHRKGMLHYDYWINRLNGKYKITTPFTIDKDGTIYHHYNSYYGSANLGNKEVDCRNIYISLVNEGWLFEDEDGQMKNWIGDVYEGDDYLECSWRNKNYWVPYTEAQFESVVELCSYLSIEHNISLKTLETNTIYNYVADFNGITYKSNYNKVYTDINPSWFFKDFKNKLEKKK